MQELAGQVPAAIEGIALEESVQSAARRRRRRLRRPNLSGDLASMMREQPVFGVALAGYDRLQVDNYVAWAEQELDTMRRENDDLTVRLGQACAELGAAREELAHSPAGQELGRISGRIREILQLAADEAADLRRRAVEDADRVLTEATRRADETLEASRGHEARTNAECERLVARAQRLHEEAEQVAAQARADAEQLRRDAADERERLDTEAARQREAELRAARVRIAELEASSARAREEADATLTRRLADLEARARRQREQEAAAAAARLADVQHQIEELQAQRDQAQAALRALTDQVDGALRDLLADWQPGPRTAANAVAQLVDDALDATTDERPADEGRRGVTA
ncbi:hypothetical protein [Modestobacter sp. SYSU DS0511]